MVKGDEHDWGENESDSGTKFHFPFIKWPGHNSRSKKQQQQSHSEILSNPNQGFTGIKN